MRWLTTWCALFLLVGCLPRVSLPPLPPIDAPLAERKAALHSHSLVTPDPPVASRLNRQIFQTKPPFVWLADGYEVWDSRDLAALLPADSATARSAALVDDHLYTGRVVMLGGLGLVLAGFGLFAAGVAQNGNETSSPGFRLVVAGSVVITTGFIASTVGILRSAFLASHDQLQAFSTYPADLAAALGL